MGPAKKAVLFGLILLCAVLAPRFASAEDGVTAASVAFTRLVGGKNELEGRLQVQIGGKTGSICAGGWDVKDARVACRELGLSAGEPANFGAGTLPVLVSNVTCKGTEGRLASCQYLIGKPCPAGGAAGVRCQKPAIVAVRIVSESSPFPSPSPSPEPGMSPGPGSSGPPPLIQGWVQVELSGGQVGPVCDIGFGTPEAQVVCRMVGKTGGRVIRGGVFGTATQPAVLNGLNCAGWESNLTACKYEYVSTPQPYCGLMAAVECTEPPPMDVRLKNGKNGNEGRLEVSIGGHWMTVCQNLFTDAAARVVCRKLGMRGGRTLRNVKWGATGLGVGISNVRCVGTEQELSACQFTTKTTGCTHATDVGVACKPPIIQGVQLINNSLSSYPTVNLGPPAYKYGTICADGFKDTAARVVCREAGFSDGHVLSSPADPADVKDYQKVINHLTCKGTERDLSRCTYDVATECKTKRAAKVKCIAQPIQGIKLVGGALSGLLEVKVKGEWGSVCNVGFGKEEAEVACRQLNLTGGRVVDYGGSFHRAVISDVVCRGTESSLSECDYDTSQYPSSGYEPGCFYMGAPGGAPVGLKCTAPPP
ncbi:hypothetical protein ABPG77_005489 [Micractinium sp. CCAP 211/92]